MKQKLMLVIERERLFHRLTRYHGSRITSEPSVKNIKTTDVFDSCEIQIY